MSVTKVYSTHGKKNHFAWKNPTTSWSKSFDSFFFQPQRPKYRRLRHQAVFCLLCEWIPRGSFLLVVESISNVTIIWILFIFLHTVSNFIVFLTKLLISVIQFHKQQMCPYKIHLVIQSIYLILCKTYF